MRVTSSTNMRRAVCAQRSSVVSKAVRFASMVVIAGLFACVPSRAGDPVFLKGAEGYSFQKNAVAKKGDANFDIALGADSLSARKIKALGGNLPDARAFATVQSWPATVASPLPGYYAVQGHDGRSIYLVQVLSVNGSGKAPSHWSASFTWEKLQ
jgi:hypothetical protein